MTKDKVKEIELEALITTLSCELRNHLVRFDHFLLKREGGFPLAQNEQKMLADSSRRLKKVLKWLQKLRHTDLAKIPCEKDGTGLINFMKIS